MTFEDGDLDRMLGDQMARHVAANPVPAALQAQPRYHAALISGGSAMTPLGHVASLVSAKAATGIAAATLAVAGAGAGGAAALTGSTSPAVWGRTVTAAVASCKADLKPGEHGIGQCVSAVARQNGAEERKEHRNAEAGEKHGKPAAHPTPRGDGSGDDADASATPAPHPAGTPTSHPTGRPEGEATPHPTGPPSALPSPRGDGETTSHPTPHASGR